ncbi:MAG: hypothetical protein LBN03_00045, partial [Bifidobacteriaceae bacterium]|nr:hypothetical protein [Bifidobacteriaceae bacterium]
MQKNISIITDISGRLILPEYCYSLVKGCASDYLIVDFSYPSIINYFELLSSVYDNSLLNPHFDLETMLEIDP